MTDGFVLTANPRLDPRPERPHDDAALKLTRTERRVVIVLAQDHNSETGGIVLGMSPRTVRFHMDNVRAKLECNTRHGAIARLIRAGVI